MAKKKIEKEVLEVVPEQTEKEQDTQQTTKTETKPKKKKINKVPLSQIERYSPSYKDGLNEAQVNERIEQGYSNEIKDTNTKTYGAIFFSNIVTFFNILCLAIAISLICVGKWSNCLFMVIIIIITVNDRAVIRFLFSDTDFLI